MRASLRAEPGRLAVSLHNESNRPVTIARALLAPSLAFEVTGEDGNPVALAPPPVPPADPEAEATRLDPGESLELEYSTGELFGGEPPSGRFSVRFTVDTAEPSSSRIESPWVVLVA